MQATLVLAETAVFDEPEAESLVEAMGASMTGERVHTHGRDRLIGETADDRPYVARGGLSPEARKSLPARVSRYSGSTASSTPPPNGKYDPAVSRGLLPSYPSIHMTVTVQILESPGVVSRRALHWIQRRLELIPEHLVCDFVVEEHF